MVCDRYNDVLICVSPDIFKSVIKAGGHAGNTWGISVRSDEDADTLQEIMKEIFLLNNLTVCLWIDEKIYHRHEQKISGLFFLLYSINYLFKQGKAVIYFVNNHSEHHNNTGNALSNSVNSLGFTCCINEVESWAISGIHDRYWYLQADNGPASKEELFSFYFDLLSRNSFVDRCICLFSPDEEKIYQVLETITEAEKAILKFNPPLHELFYSYRALSRQQERLCNENKQLQIDLTNQKKYLAVLRNEKEMEKIINFYHREYEVLPLWYKRFGHIIKLFTGKRKIRSTHHQK